MTGRSFPFLLALCGCSFLGDVDAQVGASPPEVDATAPASDDELSHLSGRLADRLKQELAEPCLSRAVVAVTVRELPGGQMLFNRLGDEPVTPASNQKLLTAAALLCLLGSEFTAVTEVRSDRAPGSQGEVDALYLVGGGDPGLNVENIYLMARAVAAAGVRRVGRLVVDDSFFDGPGRPPTWPARDGAHWYGAPTSALNAAYNVVAVHVRADLADGGSPRAWLDPFPSAFLLASQVQAGRGPLTIQSELVSAPDPGDGPAQRLVVSGRIRPGRQERVLRAVEDPALFCGHGFSESLQRVGITVESGPVRGRTPAGSTLLHAHPSQPLALLLRDMNKQSSNVFAETLLKVLGAEILGSPGTREKGLKVLDAFLQEASSRAAGCKLEDGSGLSPGNRLTTNVLTDVVFRVAGDPMVWPEFLVTLPVSGVDGTLKRRLKDGAAARQVRGKTGRLSQAVSLTGVAPIAPGRSAVFSVVVNDYHCASWQVQDAVDELLRALVADAPRAREPRSELAARVLLETEDGEPEEPGGH